MGWITTYPTDYGPGDVHVMPDDEVHEESPCCNCNPNAEKYKYGTLYTHHSYDGREGLEQALEILQ